MKMENMFLKNVMNNAKHVLIGWLIMILIVYLVRIIFIKYMEQIIVIMKP